MTARVGRGIRIGLLLGWAVAAPLPGQDTPDTLRAVTAARMDATVVPDQEAVEVRLEYELRQGADAPSAPVRIHALGVGEAEVESFRVESASIPGPEARSLAVEQGVLRGATLPLPPGDEGRLVLRYRVQRAVVGAGTTVRLHLPVLVLDLPPARTSPTPFQATVQVPEGWAISGTFPSGLTGDAGGSWSGSLQVVPAFVALRGRRDGRWRPGLDWALDGVTVLILVGVGFLGWRHLRGVVQEART